MKRIYLKPDTEFITVDAARLLSGSAENGPVSADELGSGEHTDTDENGDDYSVIGLSKRNIWADDDE